MSYNYSNLIIIKIIKQHKYKSVNGVSKGCLISNMVPIDAANKTSFKHSIDTFIKSQATINYLYMKIFATLEIKFMIWNLDGIWKR